MPRICSTAAHIHKILLSLHKFTINIMKLKIKSCHLMLNSSCHKEANTGNCTSKFSVSVILHRSGESCGPTAQHNHKIVQSFLYSRTMYMMRINKWCHLVLHPLPQISTLPLSQFQPYCEGHFFGYSWKLDYFIFDILNLDYRRSFVSIFRCAFRHFSRF